jgi:hypothetical protein
MKKAILIIGLLLLLFNLSFSQQRSYSYSSPENWTLSLHHDTIISGINVDSLLSTIKPDYTYNFQGLPKSMKGYSVEDNMPCILPKGNYSGLMLKPDTTNRCKLLIIHP